MTEREKGSGPGEMGVVQTPLKGTIATNGETGKARIIRGGKTEIVRAATLVQRLPQHVPRPLELLGQIRPRLRGTVAPLVTEVIMSVPVLLKAQGAAEPTICRVRVVKGTRIPP